MSNVKPMSNEEMITRLSEVVSEDYKWPEIPKGWRLEFIVYPDTSVEMDFSHAVSRCFWSEDNGFIELPKMKNGGELRLADLKIAGIQYMTTFAHATVDQAPKPSHLKSVK